MNEKEDVFARHPSIEELQGHMTRQMLRVMALGSLAVSVVSLISVPTSWVSGWSDVQLLFLSSSAVFILSLSVERLLHRIESQLITIVMILFIFVILIVTEPPYHVSHGRSLLIFAIPIVMSAFLIRPLSAVLVASASSVVISILSQIAGYVLPNVPAIVTFHILAVLSWKLSSHLENIITNLARSQERLQVQRNHAMLYLDILGHDVANDLQAILLALEFAEEEATNQEVLGVLESATKTLQESSSLIRDAKKLDSVNEGKLKPFELNKILSISLDVFKSEYPEVEVKSEICVSAAFVRADMNIVDLFQILLENTVEHNPCKEKKVWVKLDEFNGGYVVSIADNGVGIEDERKEALFDLSRRYGGLGLHLAKMILDKYDGRITVENRIEGQSTQGAKFNVWFPKSHSEKNLISKRE
ncbi:MAG: HAMP domain-containing histidine kinase [Candidatus Thorarchaeota archaeon]|nr:HAMP domain-containing histidine kinase [Candidatus Thorarchaeota archaeon]